MGMVVKKKVTKLKVFSVKFTDAEKNRFQLLANEHTNGNVSEWIRQAASEYRPKKGAKK